MRPSEAVGRDGSGTRYVEECSLVLVYKIKLKEHNKIKLKKPFKDLYFWNSLLQRCREFKQNILNLLS